MKYFLHISSSVKTKIERLLTKKIKNFIFFYFQHQKIVFNILQNHLVQFRVLTTTVQRVLASIPWVGQGTFNFDKFIKIPKTDF